MPAEPKTITYGVIADTHIPDRMKNLPDKLLPRLREAQVDHILHAVDACTWQVVRTLERAAPVTIVQGNRDWLLGMHTPPNFTTTINGVKVTLAHGHHSLLFYLVDKFFHVRRSYNLEHYYQRLLKDYPQSDVIVFGHTHWQIAKWVKGQVLFNPGAAYPCKKNHYTPQFGILSITAEGDIRTQFCSLPKTPPNRW
jgi:putative phosphoesterase